MEHVTAKQILKFWFGEDYQHWPEKETSRRWFMGGKPFDDEIKQRFSKQIQKTLSDDFFIPSDTETLLATIILLDQFTRNIYRGSAAAFSGDEKALKLSMYAVDVGLHVSFPAHQRIFLYMPFEHSEEIVHQQTCVRLFEEMLEEFEEPIISKVMGFSSYAKDHYDIIKQFNRFPHRNKILGRESTVAEIKYLFKGKTFGQ